MYKKKFIFIFLLIFILYNRNTILAVPPVINSVFPKAGFNNKATDITITGEKFDTSCKVYINPMNPSVVNSSFVGLKPTDIFISGNFAYVTSAPEGPGYITGLYILNISNPNNPIQVGTVFGLDHPNDVYVSGNYAYIADGYSGLQIIDILNPANPQVIKTVDTPGFAASVYVSGNYAYVADVESGIQIIDIGTESIKETINPGEYEYVSDVYVKGDYLYATVNNYDYTKPRPGYLWKISVNDIINKIINNINNIDIKKIKITEDTDLYDVYIEKDLFYFTTVSGLIVGDINVSDEFYEKNFLNIEFDVPQVDQRLGDFCISGKYAYIPGKYGLNIVDVSNPSDLKKVARIDTGRVNYVTSAVYVSGKYAYTTVTDNNTVGIFQVIDITSPVNPSRVSNVETPGFANDVDISVFGLNSYAYVTYAYRSDSSGIQVININDPKNPIKLSSYITPGYVKKVRILNNYAYLINWGELQIIDISVPYVLSKAGNINLLVYSTNDIDVSGNYAYVTYRDMTKGLFVIDITDPKSLKIIGTLNTLSKASGLHVSGNYAYVADGVSGLRIIDISNKTAPNIKSSIYLDYYLNNYDEAEDIYVSGDYAYVTTFNEFYGLYIINISDPSNPIIKSKLIMPKGYYRIYVKDNYAYISNAGLLSTRADNMGIYIIDINDPSKPYIISSGNTPGDSQNLIVTDNNIYAADGYAGLQVFDKKSFLTSCTPVFFTNETKLTTEIPSLLNGGRYNIKIRNSLNEQALLYNGFRVISDSYLPTLKAAPQLPLSGKLKAPITVNFTAEINDPEASPIINYEWDLDGDGNFEKTTTTDTANITYYSEGTYTPKVRITDTDGVITEAANTVVVLPPNLPPTITSFTSSELLGNKSLSVTFTLKASDDDIITRCDLDLNGDGNYETIYNTNSPSIDITTSLYKYENFGLYNAKARITDNDGVTAEAAITINVTGDPGITSIDPNNGANDKTTSITINGKAFDPTCNVYIAAAASPNIIGNVKPDNAYFKNVFISNNYAFVTDINDLYNDLRIIDISDPKKPTIESTVDITGQVSEVYVSGNYAYVTSTSNDGYLYIIKIKEYNKYLKKDIINPRIINSIGPFSIGPFSKNVYVCVLEDYIYVASSNKLYIYSYSNSKNTVSFVKYFVIDGYASGVYISGNYVYVTSNNISNYNLGIIDISDIKNAYIVKNVTVSGYASGVYISGDYAYIANNNSLQIIDISNPNIPIIAGSVSTPSLAASVYIDGNYAYVTCWEKGLIIIDISNPTIAVITAIVDTPGFANSVNVSGNYAFVADYSGGLQIIDINNRANPGVTSNECESVKFVDSNQMTADVPKGLKKGKYDIIVANGTGQKSNNSDFTVLDPLNQKPTINLTADIDNGYPPLYVTFTAKASDLDGNIIRYRWDFNNDGIYDEILYTSSTLDYKSKIFYNPGVYTVKVNVTDNNKEESEASINIDVKGYPKISSIDPNYGYNNLDTDITIKGENFDNTCKAYITPSNFSPIVGNYLYNPGTSFINDLYISGPYAYVADKNYGLQIIDIVNPINPKIVGSVSIQNSANDVYISGNYAYVADNDTGVQIINISDPTKPGIRSTAYTPGSASGVYVSGNYAYVADGFYGLQIIDISNPYFPKRIGSVDTPGNATRVYVSGNYAYVADGFYGLQIIDISSPALPKLIGSVDTPGNATDVYVSGNYAYVADGSNGLQIIDISSPANSSLKTTVTIAGYTSGVYISGQYAYLANGDNVNNVDIGFLQIIDISDPLNPRLFGSVYTPGFAQNIFIAGKYVYVADSNYGLQIINKLSAGSICEPISFDNNTQLTAKVPKGLMPGGYNITVFNNEGYKSFYQFTVYDAQNQPPDITSLKADPINGDAPLLVNLIADASDIDGDIISYEWFFGDGSSNITTNINNTKHLYTKPAAYYAQVRVTDNDGAQTIKGVNINVTANQSPQVYLSANQYYGKVPLTISFTANSFDSDGNIIKYEWDFNGDGIYDSTINSNLDTLNVDYTYETSGTYYSSVKVIDNDGASGQSYTAIVVNSNQPPQVYLYANPNYGKAPLLVNFYASAFDNDGNITKYEWDFNNDGIYETTSSDAYYISNIYNTTGTYIANVKVTDDDNAEAISTAVINVLQENKIPAVTLYTSPGSGDLPLLINFYAIASDIDGIVIRYEWDFDGDGNIDTITDEGNANYTYTKAGIYNARVKVMDNDGASAENAAMVRAIKDPPAIYSITPNFSYNDSTSNITINGLNFDSTCRIYMGQSNYFIASKIKTPGHPYNIKVSGNYAYAASYDSGLQIIDISDTSNIKVVGGVDTSSAAVSVSLSGNYAYVADGESGLYIIDVSDAANPMIVGTANTPGSAYNVYASGNYAYMASYDSGLQVIDCSDITNPKIVSSIKTYGYTYDVFISGNYAYVADGYNGLTIIDISDASNPKITGNVDTPGFALSVNISGKYAYIADGDSGLEIIDISDAANPTIIKTINTPGYAWNVSILNNYAYVADGFAGVQIIDISFPENSQIIGSINIPGFFSNIDISGKYAYVIDVFNAIQLIDISNSTNLSMVSTVNTSNYTSDLKVSGNYAYVADGDNGLKIVDFSDAANPIIVGSIDTPGTAIGISIFGNYAYVADRDSGLEIIDISDAANPTITGSIDTPGIAIGISISGNYAYVTDGDSGLEIIDISDAANPTITGSIDTPGTAIGISISGNYAYIADGDSGLEIIDISDAANPVIAGNIVLPDFTYDVSVSGKYAYVANRDNGLKIIDISDLANLKIIGSVDTPGFAIGVYISGNYAYIADNNKGLQIIDITDAADPKIVDNVSTLRSANKVYVSENYIYVADGGAGLHVFNKLNSEYICNPTSFVNDKTLNTYVPMGFIPGKYYVKIIDSNGKKAVSYDAFKILSNSFNVPPQVDLTAVPDTGKAPLSVTFTANALDSDGTIIGYDWDLDSDGNYEILNSSSNTMNYTYNNQGSYNARVRVTDNDSAIGEAGIAINVLPPNVPPQVSLDADREIINIPFPITFTANAIDSDGYITRYDWDLDGDGNFENTTTNNIVSYIYNKKGSYNIRVLVTDNDGAIQEANIIIKALAFPEIISIEPNYNYNYQNTFTSINGKNFDTTCRLYISPGGPYSLGNITLSGEISGFHFSDNYAYVTYTKLDSSNLYESAGLQIIDIKNSNKLKVISNIDIPGWDLRLNVLNNYAYVIYNAMPGPQLQIIDINNPENPNLLGNITLNGYFINAFNVSEKYAYIANNLSELQILDISDSSNINSIGSVNITGSAKNIYISENYAYVAYIEYGEFNQINSGLQVIDISDPANLVIVNNIPLSGGEISCFYTNGTFMYIMLDQQLKSNLNIIDISVPGNPVIINSGINLPVTPKDIYVLDNYIYIADTSSGLKIIDISNPNNPYVVGGTATIGIPSAIHVSGNYVYTIYTGWNVSGMQIIDVSVPDNPKTEGNIQTSMYTWNVYLSGIYAYIADGTAGLKIADVSVPGNTKILGSIDTLGEACNVFISGSYAYVVNRNSMGSLQQKTLGLKIIDISNPENLYIVGGVDMQDIPYAVYVSGNYAYLANGTAGLKIIDISVPYDPKIVSSIDTPGVARGITISGNYAYVADGKSDFDMNPVSYTGLHIIDIKDPLNPTLLNSIDTPGEPYSVYLTENYAYLADGSFGLQILDITDPVNTKIISNFNSIINPWSPSRSVYVSGNYAYLANTASGIQVIDISNPYLPILVSNLSNSGWALDVQGTKNYVYVANGLRGLQILDKLSLGTLCQPVNFIDSTKINTIIPARLMSGKYNIKIINSSQDESVFYNGFKVLKSFVMPPFVNLFVDTVSGKAPLKVNFYASAFDLDGNIVRYEWDLNGDGNFETITVDDTVSYTYDLQGYYFARVRVTDNDGTTGEASVVINVLPANIPPDVTLTAIPDTGKAPLSVTFTANAFDFDGYIIKYDWDMDSDGNYEITNSSNSINFIYDNQGSYTARVRVTDNDNATGEASVVINVLPAISIPKITSIVPDYGYNYSSTFISMYGENFDTTCKIYISPGYPYIVNNINTIYYAYDVKVSGNYAYVADGASGLQIIDISDSTNFKIIGRVDTPGNAAGIDVSGNYAYVADGVSGLQIIDISDSTSFKIMGSINTPGNCLKVYISGNYAYAADGLNGLQIIDVTNPLNPVIAANAETPGNAVGVNLSGNYAYVADSSSGLQIIDITNPLMPVIIGKVNTPGNAMGIDISGNYAYVADGMTGLQVIDITNLFKPVIISNLDTPGNARNISISGNYAFIADNKKGLQIINIENPFNPVSVNNIATPGPAVGIFILNDYAYVAEKTKGLQIINIKSVFNPGLISEIDTPGRALGVITSGNYAYIADGGKGLEIINMNDKKIIGSIDTPGYATNLYVSENYAYLADGASGLQIIDITNNSTPAIISSVDTQGVLSDVVISGDYAYAADGWRGLEIIDIKDPYNPGIKSFINTPGSALSVYISGYYAYVADGLKGLQIINIQDPFNPKLAGNIDTPGNSNDICVSGDYAYIADGSSGLQIIDIKNPLNPTIIANIDTPDSAYSVTVSGNYAYIADGLNGLQVIDIRDPIKPVLVGSIYTFDSVRNVYINENYIYLANYSSGINILHKLSTGTACIPATFINRELLTTTVPMGLLPGKYNLKVINSLDEQDILYNGFTVLNKN